jgi:hypothetical protein
MAADLHIHVLTPPCTEETLREFFSSTLGSKWFTWHAAATHKPRDLDDPMDPTHLVANTPSVWVGEVSWLGAMLGQEDTVPDTVQLVHGLIGERLPVLDENLRRMLIEALKSPNDTSYDTTDKDPIVAFLDEHMGERLFTVSW